MNQTYCKRKGRARHPVVMAVGLLWLVLGPALLLSQPAAAPWPTPAGRALARSLAPFPALFRGGVAAWTAQTGNTPLLYSSGPDYPDAGLQALLDSYVSDTPGDWAVSVKKLDTGQYAAVNANTQTLSASLYKLFVLYEVMRQQMLGNLSLDQAVTITDNAAAYDAGIGELHWSIGQQVAVSTLLERMVEVSDNTAAISLENLVGADTVNTDLQQLGLPNSGLHFGVGQDNLTSAAEYNRLLELIATGQVLDRASCRYMIDLLLDQELNDQLPMGLPTEIPMAHKTGTLDNPPLQHDAGIVYGASGPYVITVLSWNQAEYTYSTDLMRRLSKAVYAYFNGRTVAPARYFPETGQVVGPQFLLYYNSYGGRPIFGLPIGPERVSGSKIVQPFERARLERPAAGGPVGLGNVGRELLAVQQRHFPPTGRSNPADLTTLWFPITQQAIGQPFLTYWRNHGSDELFGPPLSNIVIEPRPEGPTRVQYFERARFELHGNSVWLGLIGQDLANLAH